MPESPYRKFSGSGQRGTSLFSASPARATLHLGSDHLLNVDTIYFTEEYHRFHFRDIQAFVIRRGYAHIAINILLAIPAVLLFWAAIAIDDIGGRIFTLVIGLLFGGLLGWSLWLGPSCRTFVLTAVQSEQLPSLNRIRRTRRILAELQPLIHAACLTAAARPPLTQRNWFRVLVRTGAGVAGLALAWFCFHGAGRILLSIPDSFHEGTLWQVPWVDR
jgi:hypothetical protein